MKKCKNCPEKEEVKNVESKKTKKFSFPSLWIIVEAENIREAYDKVKAMLEYKNKSI